jgi:hypothetical protein
MDSGHETCKSRCFMATRNGSTKTRPAQPLEGEGSYSASRNYNRKLGRALADPRAIARGAEQARRAVEGREGAELRAAEKRAKNGPRAAEKRAR